MALRYPSLSARFFIALFVLLGALGAVGAIAYHGLEQVQGANNQVFSDNYVTAQDTSGLAIDLARVENLALRITTARDDAAALALRTQLDQIWIPRVNADIARFLAIHRDDPQIELRNLHRIPTGWHAFLDLRETGPLARTTVVDDADRASDAAIVTRSLGPLVSVVAGLQSVESDEAAAAHQSATDVFHRSELLLLVAAVVALLAAIVMVRVGLMLRLLVEQQTVEQSFGEQEGEYIDTLQVTENEDEAQELLRRHVERSFEGARAVVLARNNSADRLEPKTSVFELDTVRDALVGATPRSCLAVRFGRTHSEGGARTPLMSCEICG
ncbi:MAG: hypothetical protein ABI317_16330, partial [Gaiellales bacterium]